MEQIQEPLLASDGHIQRNLGLVVADDQLFECGSLLTDDLHNRQVRLDAFHMEGIGKFAYLGMVSDLQPPLAPHMPQDVSEVRSWSVKTPSPYSSACEYGESKSMSRLRPGS
jgi:hypothetical protein